MTNEVGWKEGPEQKRGRDFERFVRTMFPEPDFKILFWSEAKRTKVPDFYVQYGEKEYRFWVEARNRKGFYGRDREVQIFGERPDRLNLLHAFQAIVLPETVFVVLGIGEDPNSPDHLFRIPVKEIRYAKMYENELRDKWACGYSFSKYDNYCLI